MTKLTSPSEQKRTGGTFNLTFAKYLEMMVTIDPAINSVCINLDEEGNEYWELDPQEAEQLSEKLKGAVKTLQAKRKRK